jgi:uroporphyrinogen-III decarboxylase
MMLEQPDLLDYLISKQLEQTVEHLRCLAAAGGDAIYIDDAMTTSDMISVGLYERFSLPAMTALVDEIHRLGHKAIVIYFGGVADRLDQIASIGADGVLVETSMKGYVNDIGDCVDRIGDQTTLFGNIDPVGVIQDGSDEDLEAEIRRQLDAGRQGRGFILSPASPLTPSTPLERIQRFIELGKEIGSVT